MSKDTIYREDAIKALYKYSFVSKDVIEREINAIPSADVPTTMTGVIDAIHEAECRGYMKGVLVGGEERPKGEWADILAELHERFDALEKELRRASAEVSAIVREYVDRPQGEWIPNSPFTGNCSECGADGNLKDNYCSNCGARVFAKDINVPNKKGADGEREGE